MKITDRCAAQGDETIFVCDFSPPKSADHDILAQAAGIGADYISVAYNPGKAVRVDSAMLAYAIKDHTGTDVIFNLATRDMNKLALQSHLLGTQLLGLENVLIVKGDVFSQKQLTKVKEVSDFKPTELMKAIEAMNLGLDYKGLKLGAPTDICIGASIDLSRGIEKEARLAHKKALAGAHYFLAQPVFSTDEIGAFLDTYHTVSGDEISQPVFFGLQVLIKDGIIFSNVPEGVREDLDKGREGTDIALELLHEFEAFGIKRIYLIPPILRGGHRDYGAAQKVLKKAK